MKPIPMFCRFLGAIALVALTVGCASIRSKEDTLVAAGFKVITPSTPAQTAKLAALPPDRVTPVRKGAKTYYVFPDIAKNQAYIGGPNQYQTYQQYRLASKIADENLAAAEMNRDASFEWDGWGGWGAWGPYGWY